MSTDTIMSMMAPAPSAAPVSPKAKPGLAATAGQEKSRDDRQFAALVDDKTAPSQSKGKAKGASADQPTAREATEKKTAKKTAAPDQTQPPVDGGHSAGDAEAAKTLPKHDGKEAWITVQAPDAPLSSTQETQASAAAGDDDGDEASVLPDQPAEVKITETANCQDGDAQASGQPNATAATANGSGRPADMAFNTPVDRKAALSAAQTAAAADTPHGEDSEDGIKPTARQTENQADSVAARTDAAVSQAQIKNDKGDHAQGKTASARPQAPKGENGLATAQATQPASPHAHHTGEKTAEAGKAEEALSAVAAKQAAKVASASSSAEKPAETVADTDADAKSADAPKEKTALTGEAQITATQNSTGDNAPGAGTQIAVAEAAERDKGVRKLDKNDGRAPDHRQDQKADHGAVAQHGGGDKTDTPKREGNPAPGQTNTAARSDDPAKLTGEAGAVKNTAQAQSADTAAASGVNTAAAHGAQAKPATESFTQILNKQAPGPHPASETVAVEIKHRAQAGDNKFIVRLDPPELGRVEVKLTISHDKSVHALLTVDNDKALEALQRDARMLDRSLQDAGLKTDQGSLNFSLKQGQQQMTGQNGGGRHPLGLPGNGALQDGEADLNAAFNTAWSGRISDRPLDLVI